MIMLFRLESIVAISAIAIALTTSLVSAAGCYPPYSPGTKYSIGTWVLATVTTTPPVTYTPCATPGVGNCSTSGFIQTGGVSVTDTSNYQCISEYWCSQVGYAPPTLYWNQAWSKEGTPCTGTAVISPTNSPIFVSLPNVGGCPSTYIANSPYEPGSRVSLNSIVYQCKSWPSSLYCPQDAYKPDPSSTLNYWKQAWERVGYCSGSIIPTNSPTIASGGGGCPPPWVGGGISKYKADDRVSVIKPTSGGVTTMVYKCKAWPYSGYCGQFDPLHLTGGSLGWELVGGCSGTITPTTSPTFAAGTVITGCPNMYVEGSTSYKSGDQVATLIVGSTTHKMIYKCREWPNGEYCNQCGFAPGTEYSNMAWIEVGPCTGTFAPTAPPTEFTSACKYIKVVNNTPVAVNVNRWTAGVSYVAGDQVHIDGNTYMCKPWPYYLWCSTAAYQPTTSATGLWNEAWSPSGPCQRVAVA